MEFVNAKNAELRSRNDQDQSQKTLLEVFLTSKDLDVKDVVTMVSDMLLAGIDTVKVKYEYFHYCLYFSLPFPHS